MTSASARLALAAMLVGIVAGCNDKQLNPGDCRVIQPDRPAKVIDVPVQVQDILGFSRDGSRLIVQGGKWPRNVFSYEIPSGRLVQQIWTNPLKLKDDVLLGFNQDASSVLAYDVMNWQVLYRKPATHPPYTTIATPPGTVIVGESLIRVHTGEDIYKFKAVSAVSEDLTKCFSATIEKSEPGRVHVTLLKLAEKEVVWERTLDVPAGAWPEFARFTRDGNYVCVVCLWSSNEPPYDGPVRRSYESVMLSAADGTPVLPELKNAVLTAGGGALLQMPQFVALREWSPQRPILWSLPPAQKLAEFVSESGIVSSPSGMVAGPVHIEKDGKPWSAIAVIDETTGQRRCLVEGPPAKNVSWTCVALSPRGRWLLLDSGNGQRAIVSAVTGKTAIHLSLEVSQRRWIHVYGSLARHVAYSDDETRVAISMGSQVWLFDLPASSH